MQMFVLNSGKNRGSALILVIMLAAVASIFALGLMARRSYEEAALLREVNRIQAEYLARSGAHSMAVFLSRPNMNWEEWDGLNSTAVDLGNSIPGQIDLQIAYDSAAHEAEIQAVGRVRGIEATEVVCLTRNGPLPGPGEGALDSTSILGWTASNGKLIADGTALTISETLAEVIFNVQSSHDRVWENPGSFELTAAAMFFENEPLSLEVFENAVLSLAAYDIIFSGTVELKLDRGVLNLDLPGESAALDGSSLNGGIPGKKYGRVFFGGGVQGSSGILLTPGAYYFPEGCQLPADKDKTAAQGGLIRYRPGGCSIVWR